MKILDMCVDYNSNLWDKTKKIIMDGNDPLKSNYINLSPADFVCWPVLIDNEEIVCFSGLQINVERWGINFARINSRFYINPKYRHRGPGKMSNSEKFLNTKYLLPVQIDKAKSLGLKGVFMSREGDHKKVFELYVNLAYRNTGYFFTVLEDRYNVCGNLDPVPHSCKQWIAAHCFDVDNTADIWKNEMNLFKI
jgi:hypothetical protein